VTVPFSDFSASSPVRPFARLYEGTGKRLLDLRLVLLAAPVAVPLVGLILFATWREGGRPLYMQHRIGRGGQLFRCWKVRTMVQDADVVLAQLIGGDPALADEWHLNQKLSRDPRITRLGRFLRRTSLDELPQLWNVLNGTMSLVGPRPFTPEQQGLYAGGHAAAYYSLRPGLSGLWQVSCRNSGSFSERVAYDDEYSRQISLWGDAVILWRTVLVVLRATGI